MCVCACDSYELSRPPDGAWGQLSDDGTWSGMVGQLFRKVGLAWWGSCLGRWVWPVSIEK